MYPDHNCWLEYEETSTQPDRDGKFVTTWRCPVCHRVIKRFEDSLL